MTWFRNLRFGRNDWNLDELLKPWGNRPSIFEVLRTTSTKIGEITLPDEETVSGEGIRWAPGAIDGVLGHHASDAASANTAGDVVKLLQELTREASAKTASKLYRSLTAVPARTYVDSLIEAVVSHNEWNEDRLYNVAAWLAKEAADREPVKIGVALLGLYRERDNSELFLTLGRHEEFTVYAAVALQNTSSNPDAYLWQLAQDVSGWGRIQCIERLAETTDEHVQSWMLRDGCENDIMPEYTALICATTGRLPEALALPHVDPPLRKGARIILSALIASGGGPAAGMESYEAGPVALSRFIDLLGTVELSMEEFLFLHEVAAFLEDDNVEYGSGDTRWAETRRNVLPKVRALIEPEQWRDKILNAIESDGDDFWAASQAARRLGIDTWDAHFRRLQRGEDEWYAVMQTDDSTRVEQVVRFAMATLPLAEIGSGPANQLGLGKEFRAHQALDFVLQDLRRFPEVGGELVLIGLRSPVVRNRNMAAKVLESWPRGSWPIGAVKALRSAIAAEPVDDTRELLLQVEQSGEKGDAS